MGCGSSKTSTVDESNKKPMHKDETSNSAENTQVSVVGDETDGGHVTKPEIVECPTDEPVSEPKSDTPVVVVEQEDAHCAPPPSSQTEVEEFKEPEEPKTVESETENNAEPVTQTETEPYVEPEASVDVEPQADVEPPKDTEEEPQPSSEADAEPKEQTQENESNVEQEPQAEEEPNSNVEEEPEVKPEEEQQEPTTQTSEEETPVSEPLIVAEEATVCGDEPQAETTTDQDPDTDKTTVETVETVVPINEEPPTENSETPATDFNSAILKAHNDYRAKHDVPELTLNSDLCAGAQAHAESLAASGTVENSSEEARLLEGALIGESIAKGDSNLTSEDATKIFYDEIENYNFEKHGYADDTCCFTQLVWKSSQQLGVGKAISEDGANVVVVCRYFPSGNTEDGYDENVTLAL